MLTESEAAEVPSEIARDFQSMVGFNLTLAQYVKTVQGKTMLESEKHFVLNGTCFQGFQGVAVTCNEDTMTDAEVERIADVDGTKHKILETRAARLEGRLVNKRKEEHDRKKLKNAAERDELELMLLRRQVAALPSDDTNLDPPQEPDPGPPPEIRACEACGKQFKDARGLNAHRMGAKH